MEQLVLASDEWKLLGRNIQIFDASNRTLGEMDFLLMNVSSKQTVHLELAVKFYLAVEDGEGRMLYPGPDPRDNWFAKLHRMRSHQFVLSQTTEAKRMLRERFGVEEVIAQQRIYGVIFDHIDAQDLSSPPFVSESCRRARWLYLGEWDNHYSSVASVGVVPKYLWPVRQIEESLDDLEILSVEQLKERANDRCVMFWDQVRLESVFLVPDNWPAVD